MMCNKVPEFSFYPVGSNQGQKTTNSKFHDPRGWIFLVSCGNTCIVSFNIGQRGGRGLKHCNFERVHQYTEHCCIWGYSTAFQCHCC